MNKEKLKKLKKLKKLIEENGRVEILAPDGIRDSLTLNRESDLDNLPGWIEFLN